MTPLRTWRAWIVVCGTALMLTACGKKSDTPPRDTTASATRTDTVAPPASVPMSDGAIVAKLGWADSVEIAQAKLAQTQAKSPEVKAYAKMMVADHTKMMKEGKEMAARAKITPTPMANDPDVAAATSRMAALKAASGTAFDSLYIRTAIDDHTKVLDMVTAARGMVKSNELRAHLEKGGPVVKHHLDEAKALQARIGGRTIGM